ncbi:MAG: YraN family protein [Acidobacteria bacterium]|nr:YraN family protein [Acidobacteriota bacterium]
MQAGPDRGGQAGEEAAASYLCSRGYRILARRYRRCGAEIDLVARRRDVLAFVEVKMRRSHGAGSPFEAVPLRKQTRIARAAALFLAEFPELEGLDCRFDVVGVEPERDGSLRIEHLTDAFQAPDSSGT